MQFLLQRPVSQALLLGDFVCLYARGHGNNLCDILSCDLSVRAAGAPGTHPGSGFIKQVNCLVRQVTVSQIATGKLHRGLYRFIRDGHAVMLLIAFPQPFHDADRLLRGWFIHHHALKTPLQRTILFNGFAVFRNGGRSHQLQLPACQLRLENIGGVHCAFRRPDPDNRMQLVDKQNNAARADYLVNRVFDPLLKIPAVFGTCHHGSQVQ